ncbi:ABC transporter permease [Ferrovibrio terrae]|uniref:ABC transporter permease n=1 Tax=Ferrovibrio terrae TaxID=2594003 RepID=UPI003137B1A6
MASAAVPSVLALAAAISIGGLLIVIMAPSSPVAFSAFVQGAFGSKYAIGASLNRATVLALVGLGFIYAFRANLTNIGGEGQIAMGGMAAAAVALKTGVGSLPFGLAILIPAGVGALAGGAWAMLAGWLKVRRGTNEVISTLLLSFIALWLVYWAVHSDGLLRQPRTDSTSLPESVDVPVASMLPMISAPTHIGVLIALLIGFGMYLTLMHTPVGLRLQATGYNPLAARRAGLNITRMVLGTLFVSGACAGLAGAFMILGEQYNLKAGFSSGYGIDGLVVGLLARGSVGGVILFALLFGFLRSGGIGMEIAAGVPSAVVLVMQGLIIIVIAGLELATGSRRHAI